MVYKGADINAKLKDGKTLLMLAATVGTIDKIKALIQQDADLNARETVHGWTALVYAIWNGNVDAVQALISAGADPKQKDPDGKTALDHAVQRNIQQIIELIQKT
jgi:ankyrin repeat protein